MQYKNSLLLGHSVIQKYCNKYRVFNMGILSNTDIMETIDIVYHAEMVCDTEIGGH